MRTWALIALLTVGCDDKDTEGAPPSVDTTPEDTTPEDTIADTDDADDTDDNDDTDTDPDDTGSGTDSGSTDDTAVVDAEPCEGRDVGILVGQCAVDFTLVDQNGDNQTLYDYAGQVVLLDFSGFT